MIHGPAGFGKTTLALQYLKALKKQHAKIAWLSLYKQDNDISRFTQLLQQALAPRQTAVDVTKENGEKSAASRNLWGWLLSAMADKNMSSILFMDDFEVISDRTILETLESALLHLPKGRQVVILSRKLPELKLSKLALTDELLIIGPEELKFTQDECSSLMHKNIAWDLTNIQIENIYRHTDGWPAALKLSSIVLREQSSYDPLLTNSTTEHPLFIDYFMSNILDTLPPHIRRFLFFTSIMERFNAESCNIVAETDNAEETLNFLKTNGLFLQVIDEEQKWFKYHGLFGNFLYHQFRETFSVDDVDNAHLRAYQWFTTHSKPHQAIPHALKSNRLDLAGHLMDQHVLDLLHNAQINTILDWSFNFNDNQLPNHKNLLISVCWSYIFLRNRPSTQHFISILNKETDKQEYSKEFRDNIELMMLTKDIFFDDLDQAEIKLTNIRSTEIEDATWFKTGAPNCRSYIELINNRFEQARQAFIEAQARQRSDPSIFTNSYTFAIEATSHLIQGELELANQSVINGITQLTQEDDPSATRYILLPPHAIYLYETNQIEKADKLLTESLPLIREFCTPDWLLMAYTTLSRIRQLQGKIIEAFKLLEELERVGYAGDLDRVIASARWEMVRLHLLGGNLIRAEEMALAIKGESISATKKNRQCHPADIEADGITEARLMIYTGAAEAALNLLDQLEKSNHPRRVYRSVKLSILKALAYQADGKQRQARRTISRALKLAQNQKFVRSFVDEGDQAIALIQELKNTLHTTINTDSDSKFDDFLNQLLTASGKGTDSDHNRSTNELVEQLTSREMEFLQLISDGHSNRTISQRLAVTESTVKFHLKNIYSKFGVKKRTQAIARARQLGLIK